MWRQPDDRPVESRGQAMPISSRQADAHPGTSTASVAPFPDAPRVVYQRNALVEVICQVRFPPVLRIEAELPAAFQDRIRQLFPVYKDESGSLLAGVPIPDEVLQLLRSSLPAALQKAPRAFAAADEMWTITLAKDFLALSAKRYTRWEEFRRYLEPGLDSLEQIYEPAFYTRIGLRYRNVIRRSSLGLENVGWQDLLRHQLAGELTAPELSEFVEQTARQTLVRLPEFTGKVQIRHGLSVERDELCYVIDNDLFTEERTERSNVIGTLEYFNAQAHKLFRWCISDRLHEAMGPQPLE